MADGTILECFAISDTFLVKNLSVEPLFEGGIKLFALCLGQFGM